MLSDNIIKEQTGGDDDTPPDQYNHLAPTVATTVNIKDQATTTMENNNDISIASCKAKHCLIPKVTFLQHFSKSNYREKNGGGLHRYKVEYKQAEGRLFCADCADDTVGMKRRLANVVFRSDEYQDYLRQRMSWFERDFIDSY